MSSTEQNISAVEVDATHATINSINSGSIVNTNTITTEGLTVDGSALVQGNLVTNGSATIYGALKAIGGISFGDVAFIHDGTDFTINGNLSVKGSAIFGFDSIIGHDSFIRGSDGREIEEGVISAHNLRASNRLFVGDSSFEVNAIGRTLDADTFTATFADVKSAKTTIANGVITTLRSSDAHFDNLAEFVNAKITGVLTANEIQVQSFTAISEFLAKGLTVDGSAKITGGLVISGANQLEAALCVNNMPAIFNHGIKVYHKSGVLAQTLTVFGTTNTLGTGTEESDEEKYAFNTDIGVQSRFQGDVLVKDATVKLNNSPLLAERIVVAPVSTIVTKADTLNILKSGDGFDVHAESQLTYDSSRVDEDDLAGVARSSKDIRERAATPYTGRIVDLSSTRSAALTAKARAKDLMARKQARAISVTEMTRPFRVHSDEGTQYRLDAGGNVLLKKAIIEKVQASKLSANEIVADTFRTNNFAMENVLVEGVVTAKEGASIGNAEDNSGTSEVYGDVYNYGNVVNKDASVVEFRDQASQRFAASSTLLIQDQASFRTMQGSYISLHGLVEIDMDELILVSSKTGKKYKFMLRDAENAEGDNPGDIAMEFGEITETERAPVMTTESIDTRNKATLRADLEEFQARLKRI